MPDGIPAVPLDISKSFDGVCDADLLQKTIIMGLLIRYPGVYLHLSVIDNLV